MPKFEMEITRIGKVGGGRTVFSGWVTGEEVKLIGRCKCEFWDGDSLVAVVDIGGEVIFDPYQEEAPRAVTTTDPVNIEGENLPPGKYRLVCRE